MCVHHFLVLVDDLVLLQAGQALQAHLRISWACASDSWYSRPAASRLLRQVLGTKASSRRPAAGASSISTHQGESHARAISSAFASGGVGEALMSAMISSMLASATARPSRMWPRSRALRSSNTVRRVTTSRRCAEALEHLLEVQQLRPAVDQRDHVHAEGVLQLRLLVQVVQHDFRHFAALELDHDAHAGLVGLVADVADAFQLLVAHQLGDALEQRFLFTWYGSSSTMIAVRLPSLPNSSKWVLGAHRRRGRGRCGSRRARPRRRR